MRLLFLFSILCFSMACLAQRRDIVDGYITLQFTKTINDLTKGNNPWGIGTGLHAFFNVSKLFRPVAELTGDIYLENDKVARIGSNNEAMPTIATISKVLVGPSIQLGRFTNASLTAGASLTDLDVHFTLKPSVQFFLNKKQSVFVKLAYIHVYDRGNIITEDFTSWSTGVGLRVF